METINYKNYKIQIEYDENAANPRTEWDNLGTMVCFHNRYNLGDKNDFSLEEFKEFIKKEEKNIIALPLYLYDHSGITISSKPFSCKWDSGQVGYIYITKEKVRKEYNWKVITKKRREQIIKYLEGEIETYDDFLTGAVYGFQIVDKNGEEIDSCYGFYGYDHKKSGLLEHAENSIDCHIKEIRKKHFEKLKNWIKSKVDIQYRSSLSLI